MTVSSQLPPAVPHSAGDIVSGSVVVIAWLSNFIGLIPVAAAVAVSVAGFVYYVLMIASHPAFKSWLHARRERKIIKMKSRLLAKQLAMVRDANGDREFWGAIAAESQKVLAELGAHHAGQDRELRQREQIVESKARVLQQKEEKLQEVIKSK